jgi:EAL domain-containing protein (putative c-di-GMP-specific phosphodiesterase class I)
MDKKCDLAFSNRNIEVYYQPIYNNSNLSFTSAEALVRLKDEDGKLIYPGDFIEEMEKDGRIVELGKLVFSDVCKFISENDMEKLGLEYIEVNLSAVQCMQEKLASSYINIMKKYNVDPKYINLEITETAQSTRITLLKNMEILKEYGVSFSLDDFGTGNSNLNYVIEMPVKIVKFDKTMVNSYFDNRIASFVMNSTIDMIKGLGHKIVFEGIENENQINQAKKLKIDYIQGYFYSKPIDKDSFIAFIKENNTSI